MRGLVAVARKELALLLRDRGLVGAQLAFPPLLLVVFGVLFSVTLREVPVAVRDQDGSAASRELVRSLAATGTFRPAALARPGDALDDGTAMAVLQIPPGFGARRGDEAAARGGGPDDGAAAEVIALVDGSDAAAEAARSALDGFLASARRAGPRDPALGGRALDVTGVVWFNPERRDAAYFVPGVVALLVFGMSALFAALPIAREKDSGAWAALAAAPIGDLALLGGKLVAPLVQVLLLATALLAIAFLGFGIPARGSLALVALGTGLFALAGIGIGGTFAALASDENGAWRLVQILVLLPGFVLSGFLFPIEGMPLVAQLLSRIFPVRPYLELLRGVLLRGADAAAVAVQLAALAAFAAGSLTMAAALLGRARRPA
jgi:ABC-2 type transport system permease protein